MASQVLLACPTSRMSTRWDFGLDLPQPDCLRDETTAPSEISRFPLMKLMHMPQVSDSGEPNEHLLSALPHIAFPIVRQGQHSRTVISELNTAPMHTPTNASPRHHWSSRHSSGPERIANPYSVEDLALKPHRLLHADFDRRFPNVPFYDSTIEKALRRRAGMVLAVARENANLSLLLGVWCCGVFRNDPNMVADAFSIWLESPSFLGCFDRVVFAVYEKGRNKQNLRAF